MSKTNRKHGDVTTPPNTQPAACHPSSVCDQCPQCARATIGINPIDASAVWTDDSCPMFLLEVDA